MFDAQASAERTGIGSWWPVLNKKGEPDPWLSPWFSLEMSKSEWPWVCGRSEKPSLMISTLEAVAVVGLKVFCPQRSNAKKMQITVMPTRTDNRDNGAALNKLMTRYPASAALIEMACMLKRLAIKAVVGCTRRNATPRQTHWPMATHELSTLPSVSLGDPARSAGDGEVRGKGHATSTRIRTEEQSAQAAQETQER